MSRFTFTSESVSEGHPDKVCDYISDSILDACFEQDTKSRVACETLVKSDTVVLAGEITTNAKLDYDKIVRQAVKEIGYTDATRAVLRHDAEADLADHAGSRTRSRRASPRRRARAATRAPATRASCSATRPTNRAEMMPLPILLAHKLMKGMADDRKAGKVDFLRPDSKSQVSLTYDGNDPKEVTAVVISTQHTPAADQKKITEYVREDLGPRALGSWWNKNADAVREPDRQLHPRRTVGRRRRHRPQDHRRQLRRLGPSRRRRVQRQGPVEGRSQLGVLLPLRRASRSSPRASRRRPRFRSATRSAWRSRCR